MNDFVLFGDQVINLLRLFTKSGQRSAGARRVVHRSAVVVSKLDEHKIASLHVGQHLVPQAFGDESPAAASGTRPVENSDLRRIEVRDERIAPPTPAIGVVVCRRITDDEKGGQFGINLGLLIDALTVAQNGETEGY
jgi:hypothetical protein